MEKCLKIMFNVEVDRMVIQQIIQRCSKDIVVEGVAQLFPEHPGKVIICGSVEDVDIFIDRMYEELAKSNVEEPVIEPFLKDRDYRGVFRIVE